MVKYVYALCGFILFGLAVRVILVLLEKATYILCEDETIEI